ncbi:MAG: MFS transporter [Armatimonadetes bacterium]|nr:MFS transporter [Armatimonadota bacterium]
MTNSARDENVSFAPADATASASSSTRWALAGLSLSMLMASLDTSIANAGLPTLAHAFGASFQQVQWIVLSYLLAVTTLIVSVGRLGDITGRRRLLLVGISLFTVASIVCGVAPLLGVLIAARAAQGLGAAMMMALTIPFVAETVPKERTGSAMGLLGAMSAIGTALGPSLGGLLISAMGWRAIFLVNVPFGIMAFILAYRCLPGDLRRLDVNAHTLDFFGTVLLGVTLAAYALAMTMGRGSFGSINIALITVALVGLSLFLLVEARVKTPLIQLAMFRNFQMSAGLISSGLVSTVMMSTLVVGPFYLSRALGLHPMQVGLALSIGPAVVALNGVPAGRLADRFGASEMTIVGLGTMVIGSLLLAISTPNLGVPGYIAPIIVVTSGYALFQTANNTSIMSGISPDQRGVISGLLNLSRNLGLITGASAMGAVFAVASGATEVTAAPPQSVASGMRLTFAVGAVLLVIALAVASWSRNASTNHSRLGNRIV